MCQLSICESFQSMACCSPLTQPSFTLDQMKSRCTCCGWSVQAMLVPSWCAEPLSLCVWLFCSFCARQPHWGELVTTAPVSGVLIFKCEISLEGPYCLQIWALCSTEHFPGVLGTRANLAENDLLVNNSSSSKVWAARKAQWSVNFSDFF